MPCSLTSHAFILLMPLPSHAVADPPILLLRVLFSHPLPANRHPTIQPKCLIFGKLLVILQLWVTHMFPTLFLSLALSTLPGNINGPSLRGNIVGS